MHAIDMLLQSELFTYHDARMVGIMMIDAQEVSLPIQSRSCIDQGLTRYQNTHPHELYILYHLVQEYGNRHPSLFKSHRKWKKLLPTLGEIIGVECEEVSTLFLMDCYLVFCSDGQDIRSRPATYRGSITTSSDRLDV